MCTPPRVGRSNSMFDLPQVQKESLVNKFSFLTKKRVNRIVKNILHNFLDNLADFIFINGKIYTMDQKNPEPQAVAIKGNLIVFAGKLSEAISYRGHHTKIVDLQDKVLLPGFIDPHIHMCFTMFRHWLDLSPFVNSDMDQVKAKISDRIQELKQKPDQWITGQLFDPTVMSGTFDVSIQNLDKICPNNPLFILQANGHVAHVNSSALKLAGITKSTQNPPHGRFVKKENGQLTGQLQESAVMLFKKYLLGSAASYLQNFKQFLHHCASKGCTSLHDCGIGIVDPKADMSILLEVIGDQSPVRYSGFLVSTSWDTWMQQKMQPEYKDHMLRIHGIKCWADGSAQGGSAFMREPYKKKEWGKGNPNYSLQTLTQSIKVAHDKGWQVGVHANGDAGIDMVLDAFETVQKLNPKPDLRHRIQHCTVCHKQQLQRMKQLNIYPSFLIGHVYYYGHVFRDYALGEKRGNLVDPMKSAADLGLRPTMHSDYNCQPVDPIRCLYTAVTRKMKSNGEVLNSSQCLSPYEALKALTIDSAWQCHLDDITGSIEKGKKADFVILDKNPLKIPQNQLLHIKVVQTWMDGQRRYKSEEMKNLMSYNSKYSIESRQSLEEDVQLELKPKQSLQQKLQQIKQKSDQLEKDGENQNSVALGDNKENAKSFERKQQQMGECKQEIETNEVGQQNRKDKHEEKQGQAAGDEKGSRNHEEEQNKQIQKQRADEKENDGSSSGRVLGPQKQPNGQ